MFVCLSLLTSCLVFYLGVFIGFACNYVLTFACLSLHTCFYGVFVFGCIYWVCLQLLCFFTFLGGPFWVHFWGYGFVGPFLGGTTFGVYFLYQKCPNE